MMMWNKIKTLITFALLIATFVANAQPNVLNRVQYKVIRSSNVPNFIPNNALMDRQSWVCQDTLHRRWYIWDLATVTWQLTDMFDSAGSSLVNVTIGATTTLPPGSNATVTNVGDPVNVILEFGIPRGDPGSSGSGGGISFVAFPFVFPKATFGAIGQNRTFAQEGYDQTYVDTNYAGTGATVNDNIDWAAMQMCINSGKSIHIDVNLYINKSLNVSKTNYNLWIVGYNKTIYSGNKNAFSFFLRPTPLNLTEAETMAQAHYYIQGITLSGDTIQTGFDLGSGYGCTYQNIRCINLYAGIHLKFSLKTIIKDYIVTQCLHGVILDYYQQPWATRSTTASNTCSIISMQCYGSNTGTNIGCLLLAADGLHMIDITFEGFKMAYGVKIDQQGLTTSKKFIIDNVHFECTQGISGTALIKSNMDGGFLDIRNLYGHQTARICDAESLGPMIVSVTNVAWWVGVGGKFFMNKNCGWAFYNLSNNIVDPGNINTSIQAAFVNNAPYVVPTPTTGVVVGYNQFKVVI
jgi:hypothetical protein